MASAPSAAPPSTFTYRTLDDLAVMVKVKPNATGTFDAELLPDPNPSKAKILEAIAEYMAAVPKPDLAITSIIKGGSSNGGKSRRKRKSKKARKGKSLRRK